MTEKSHVIPKKIRNVDSVKFTIAYTLNPLFSVLVIFPLKTEGKSTLGFALF
jgi:hypothetical protein